MELDKDYLDYLRAAGEESGDPKFLWACVAMLADAVMELQGGLPGEGSRKTNLTGQFKIQPQGGGGYPKGPPQTVIS